MYININGSNISLDSPPIYLVLFPKIGPFEESWYSQERGGGGLATPSQFNTHICVPRVPNWDKGNNFLWKIYVNGKFQRKFNGNVDLTENNFLIAEKKILLTKVFGKHDFEMNRMFVNDLYKSRKFS